MSSEKDGRAVERDRIDDAVITLGVYMLSNNMTLRESWRAVRNRGGDDDR